MDKDQKRYATQRVKEAADDKLAKLKDKHTKPGKEASDRVKLSAIRNHEVELKRSINMDTPLRDAFEWGNEPELDEKAYEKEAAPIRAAAKRALDAVMFSEFEDARRAVEDFCK